MPSKRALSDVDAIPNAALRIRCDPNWRLDSNWARGLHDYDLWYVWGGRGQMLTSDGAVDLCPGVGLWMRPGRRYEATQDPQNRLGVTAIHFSLGFKRKVLRQSEFDPPVELFEPLSPAYFDAATSHIAGLYSRPGGLAIAAPLLKSLLLELVANAQTERPDIPINRYHQKKLTKLISEIRDHPENDFKVKALAVQCGYSPDHFTRVFRTVTGCSPKEFAVNARMARAQALLRESSHTVSQIADLLGYQDLGFFSRQFKARLGVSPTELRRPRQ